MNFRHYRGSHLRLFWTTEDLYSELKANLVTSEKVLIYPGAQRFSAHGCVSTDMISQT